MHGCTVYVGLAQARPNYTMLFNTPDVEHAHSEPCYMHAYSGEGSALLFIH